MVDYFTGLFTATSTEWEAVVQCVQSRIIDEMNQILNTQVVDSEVKAALFCKHPDKSPGTGGMSTDFYQKF